MGSVAIFCAYIIIIFFLVFAGVVDPIITWIYKLIIDCIGDFANIRWNMIIWIVIAYEVFQCIGDFANIRWNMIIWIVIAYEVFQCILQIINYIKDHLAFEISYKLNRNILVTIHNKSKNIRYRKARKNKIHMIY